MPSSSRDPESLPRTARELKAFLERLGLRPRKRFGQNFMVDPNLLEFLVRAAGVAAGDRVLEIGTGSGLLTLALIEAGARIVTVEADADLYRALDGRLPAEPGVRRILGDCLASKRRLSPEVEAVAQSWGRGEYLVVANLPYNVSVPVIMNLLGLADSPRRIVVTVQKEVADRLLAEPGGPAYGRVTVEIHLRAVVKRLRNLGPSVFWPRPEVDSSVIEVVPRPRDDAPVPSDFEGFQRFLDAVFGQRRKRMAGVVDRLWPGAAARLAAAGVPATARAEQIAPEALLEVFEALVV